MSGNIELWTSQSSLVWDQVNNFGRATVKLEYIRKKYEEVQNSFLLAYKHISEIMESVVKRCDGAESPYWHFVNPLNFTISDFKPVKLSVPEDKVFLFDSRKWTDIINLSYVAESEEDRKEFKDMLNSYGIAHDSIAMTTPYYPQVKSMILSSWKRLIEDRDKILNLDSIYIKAATWEIDSSWLK